VIREPEIQAMIGLRRQLHRRLGAGPEGGLTYIELLVALMVLGILATAVIPLARWDEKRRRERILKGHLETMRAAIDRYKQLADQGLIIMDDVEQMNYPRDLDELVDGVEVGDPQEATTKTIQFLRRIPEDPFTGEAEWGRRSYQDEWDSDGWGGENVWDVYSLSELQALDGTWYKDW
jgi:general secretion pathway protein G